MLVHRVLRMYRFLSGRTVCLDTRVFLAHSPHHETSVSPRRSADVCVQVCDAAVEANVDVLVLCDTNGGSLPWEVSNDDSQQPVFPARDALFSTNTRNPLFEGLVDTLSMFDSSRSGTLFFSVYILDAIVA